MNRSPLEKASWIAGIVSAAIAIWALAFPPGQAKEEATMRSPTVAVSPKSGNPLVQAQTSIVANPVNPAGLASPFQACTSPEVIATLRRQADLMSTYEARDAAYRPLVVDAICLKDLNLATEIANLASTYARRDELYQQILDAALSAKNRELAEKLAGLMSTYNSRDEARKKIMTALRGIPQ